MRSWTYSAFSLIFITLAIISCSDAEIVDGTYKGCIYSTDTIEATANAVKINDGMIRIDIKANGSTTGFVEYAQLTKNSEEAYNLKYENPVDGIVLSGYYYQGFLHINALINNYVFEGQLQ